MLQAEQPVDFRHIVDGMRLGQPNLDPADPLAYRLPSGASLTCDGAEAEIALPPTFIGPGFAFEVAARANLERASMMRCLPRDMEVEGYSTHISVSVPDALTQAVCRMYATTFAPAMMLLLDRRESAGLLIRPRPGRVELGGDYLVGDQLAAAAAFAVASVLNCADLARQGVRDGLPDELDVHVEQAVVRYGWYVDRTAFGGDLYVDGRSAALRTIDGEAVSAQRHLEDCWRLARQTIEGVASADELALVDEAVRGERPLPTERYLHGDDSVSTSALLDSTPYGEALTPRERPTFEMAPVMVTWDLVVFLLRDIRRTRRAFAAVPGTDLAAFLRDVDCGELDEDVAMFMRKRPRGNVLRRRAQVAGPTLFKEIGPRVALLRPELGHDGTPMPLPVAFGPVVRWPRSWLSRLAGFNGLPRRTVGESV